MKTDKIVKEELENESKKLKFKNFTFKKIVASGRWRSFDAQNNYEIKLNKILVGGIDEIRTIGPTPNPNEGKFTVGLMVYKTDVMEDGHPNCPWKWIRFKKLFDTAEDAKQFVSDNSQKIQEKYNLRTEE